MNNCMKQNNDPIDYAMLQENQDNKNAANKPSISVMENQILILLHWINELHPIQAAMSNLSSFILPKV